MNVKSLSRKERYKAYAKAVSLYVDAQKCVQIALAPPEPEQYGITEWEANQVTAKLIPGKGGSK